MENLATDNSGAAIADNPAAGPVSGANGTGSPGGQAQEATPAGELFKGVDPNRLPPEAKAHYDSMLKDYRDKTARLSETTKAEVAKSVAAYEQKAKQYDQIAQQEEFVKQWNAYVETQSKAPQNGASGQDDHVSQMKAQLQEITQKIQTQEMAQITSAFADATDEKGQALHPEFDNLNSISIGKIPDGSEFSLLRGCIELSNGNTPQEKLQNGYKMAKAVYDGIFEAGKKAGMGRLQTKQQNGSIPPSNSVGDVLSTTEKKPKNAREALDMARRGVVVSRD